MAHLFFHLCLLVFVRLKSLAIFFLFPRGFVDARRRCARIKRLPEADVNETCLSSGLSVGKNFEATTVSQSFKAISDSFPMYQMRLTLHLKQLRCHISQSPHKSVFERLGACGRCRHDQGGHCGYASSCQSPRLLLKIV